MTTRGAKGRTGVAPDEGPRVMVSSTSIDLMPHREGLIKLLHSLAMTPLTLEFGSTAPEDVLTSSLQLVRQSDGYICVISHKYGFIPQSSQLNPSDLSLTELEFNEAIRLGLPVATLVIGPDHLVRSADVEKTLAASEKLNRFRERACGVAPSRFFNDLPEFEVIALEALVELRTTIMGLAGSHTDTPNVPASKSTGIPLPRLWADSPYIGSQAFAGRRAELESLSAWAGPADPHPVLLLEGSGGNGKSSLAWQWTAFHATSARSDWAGRFWYSFYDRGSVLSDFCRQAIAFMAGRSHEELRRLTTLQLGHILLAELQQRPWLITMDGVERLLLAYARPDPSEPGADRLRALRPEDDDLLRLLARAAPSKLLITSRLTPRALLTNVPQPIPGVKRIAISGLRPVDAEQLIRAGGVRGSSPVIQRYLQEHCDCNPLIIGVIGGLVKDYSPDRGNFDAWASDPAYGGKLADPSASLLQDRRNILQTALAALSPEARNLLTTLALLDEPADEALLLAVNPHVHGTMRDREGLVGGSPAPTDAEDALSRTVADLEGRGLLYFDSTVHRYGLHPIVRGAVADSLLDEDLERFSEGGFENPVSTCYGPWDLPNARHEEFSTAILTAITRGEAERRTETDEPGLAPHDRLRIAQLIEDLSPDLDIPAPAEILQARRNAEARSRLLHEFGALTSSQVADLLGSDARNRASVAHRLRKEGRLLGVSYKGTMWFPGFQFRNERIDPAIADVLAEFGLGGATEWEIALWFSAECDHLDGARPVDVLAADPDAVVRAARVEVAHFGG